MELIKCIKDSLEKQKDVDSVDYSDSRFIDDNLTWFCTIEGGLFWYILHTSYYKFGVFDYITLCKLYHKFGKDVFHSDIYISDIYGKHFINGMLSDKGLELLFEKVVNYKM